MSNFRRLAQNTIPKPHILRGNVKLYAVGKKGLGKSKCLLNKCLSESLQTVLLWSIVIKLRSPFDLIQKIKCIL